MEALRKKGNGIRLLWFTEVSVTYTLNIKRYKTMKIKKQQTRIFYQTLTGKCVLKYSSNINSKV